MEESILTSTKNILGLAADYTAFDLPIITFISSALSTAEQAGAGITTGFLIQDESAVWADLGLDEQNLAMLKNYVYLKARLEFDPPPTSFSIEAMERRIAEFEYRMNTNTSTKAGTT